MSRARKPNSRRPGGAGPHTVVVTPGGVLAGFGAEPYRHPGNRPGILEAPPGEHRWIVTVAYAISAETAAAVHERDEPAHLDMENIVMTATGCYVCEEQYSAAVAARPCPGDPGPPY